MKGIVLTIISVVCLCVVFLTSGIMLCINTPQITENLSRATALVDSAQFSRDQLVVMADKTRGFVAGEIDKKDIYSTIEKINKEANTGYFNYEDLNLSSLSDQLTLDSRSMNHLDDVRALFANVKIAFFICLAGAIISILINLIFTGTSAIGKPLLYSGLIVFLGIIALGAWIVIDFNAMFNWLHSIFFTGGSWIFSEKSLLISMYPTPFWIGMAIICAITSIALSIVSMIIGKIIK